MYQSKKLRTLSPLFQLLLACLSNSICNLTPLQSTAVVFRRLFGVGCEAETLKRCGSVKRTLLSFLHANGKDKHTCGDSQGMVKDTSSLRRCSLLRVVSPSRPWCVPLFVSLPLAVSPFDTVRTPLPLFPTRVLSGERPLECGRLFCPPGRRYCKA